MMRRSPTAVVNSRLHVLLGCPDFPGAKRTHEINWVCRVWILLVVVMASWTPPAAAQILVWSGGNGGNANDWARAQNWTPNGPPSDSETVQFDDNADASNLARSIAAVSRSVGDITFSSGTTNAYNISGSAKLTVNNSAGITNASATSQTFSVSTLALGGSQTWSPTGTGNLTFFSAVSLGANTLTLDGSNTGTGSISGVVSGSGSMLKSGSTIWTLSGTNTFTGITTLNAGTLLYTGATASTNRAFTLTNATTSTTTGRPAGPISPFPTRAQLRPEP